MLRIGAFATLYFIAALLGTLLSKTGSSYVSFWPPGGLYLGALLLVATHRWWSIVLGAAIGNLAFDLSHGTVLWVSIGFFAGNTLHAVVGAWATRRLVNAQPALASVSELFGMMFWGAVVGSALGGCVGATTLLLGHLSHDFVASWVQWTSGTSMATVLVAPVVLSFGRVARDWRVIVRPLRFWLEVVALIVALAATQVLGEGREYIVLLILLWSGVRFGTRGAALTSLGVALLFAFTAHAESALSSPGAARGLGLASMQVYLAVASVVALVPAIALDQKTRATAALYESEVRFRSTFEQAFIGIAHVSLDGRWLRANQRLCDMLGYTHDELLSCSFSSLTHPSDVEEGRAALERFAAGELREYTRVKRYLRKDGSVVWVSLVTTLVHDERGAPLYLASFLEDITDRKRAEEEMELVKTSIDRAPLAAFWLDREGTVVYVSDEACRATQYRRDELLGTPVVMTNPSANEARWEELFERIKSVGPDTRQSQLRRKDGSEFPVEITSSYFERGSREYCLGFAHDVTERLQAEREREALQSQLNHAQRLESVGRLAGGVAHDFNNMLTVIQLTAQQAMETVEMRSPLYHDLRDIETAASRSAELTRQLLAFARKQTIHPRVLNLNETIGSILNMLRRLLGENLELDWRPGWLLWPVLMDPSQVDQLLTNLCVNARDAISDVGRVVIETANVVFDDEFCKRHPRSPPGEYVRIRVSDNGCGMDATVEGHIFEPFFTTKAEGKGTGLGLATVYGIVSQNNGLVEVETAPQQGTTFSIHLPRHLGHVDALHRDFTASVAGKETVLVVEDELVILRLLLNLLQKLGYSVVATRSPVEALELSAAHQGAIDLLLSDVVMPEMSGRDLATQIATRWPQIKCLFMSGYTADVIGRDGVVDAQVAFIQKPFAIEDLAKRIRALLDEPG